MQLPSIDRTPNLRPVAAASASMVAGRVLPVAPVNPSVSREAPGPGISPGVLNLVNQANKPAMGEGVHHSVVDPTRQSAEAITAPKDWTIHRPAPEKVEFPPRIPLYKMLIDHVKAMWTASASAIQVEQVKNHLETPQPLPSAIPGTVATEVLTYTPRKITKTENI